MCTCRTHARCRTPRRCTNHGLTLQNIETLLEKFETVQPPTPPPNGVQAVDERSAEKVEKAEKAEIKAEIPDLVPTVGI